VGTPITDVRFVGRGEELAAAYAEAAGERASLVVVGGDAGVGKTRLLAEFTGGRSNRQTAEALYITEKAASVHVSNILRKLAVASRGEAAAAAYRRGLVGSRAVIARTTCSASRSTPGRNPEDMA
jgi:DNA-binding CsgD family transcriptional regulator